MIDYINMWKNNDYIITHQNDYNIYIIQYKISIISENNIIKSYNLPLTRILLGVTTIPDKNIYIIAHYKYENNLASLIIDYYNIDDSYNLTKLNNFIINYNYSCNNLLGRLYILNDLFYIVLGDPDNYDSLSFIEFNHEKILKTEEIDIYNLETNYIIPYNYIIESEVFAFNHYFINIKLVNNLNGVVITSISNFDLSFRHKFENFEVESRIITCYVTENTVYCIVRIKLEDKVDILHIDYFFIDILIDIYNDTIKDISNKINDEFYNIDSSISFNENNEAFIWFETGWTSLEIN